MRKLRDWTLSHWHLSLGTGLFILLVLAYGIQNDWIQIFHYDMIEQYVRFVERGYDLIRTPGFEWWDYNHFLGASIFSYGYYFLFSPFWLLFAMLPSKDLIPQAVMFVSLFKLWVLFMASSYYFSKITQDKVAIFAGASIFTFGAFTMGYYQYGFYTDAMVFVPLVMVGIEQFVRRGKSAFLILSVAALAIVNVYLFIPFTAFFFLYAFFRYQVTTADATVKSTLKMAMRFIGVYLLSIACSAVISWPNLRLLLSSSRISASQVDWLISFPVLFRYVTSWLLPIVDRNEFNPLISKLSAVSYGYSGGAAVYSFILSPLLLSQILFFKKDRQKLWISIFYGVLSLIALFPPLYFLLQGNIDTRWMVMFILLNGYMVAYVIDHRTQVNRWVLLASAIIIGLVLSAAYVFSLKYGYQPTRIYFDIAKRNIILLGALVAGYLATFFFIKTKKVQNMALTVLLCLEVVLVIFNIFFNPVDSISMTPKQLRESSLEDFNVVDKIKSEDPGLYRMEVIQESGYNDPQSKDYMGLTFYSSVYNFNVDGYIQNQLSSAGGWLVGNNTGKWMVKNLLGSKYWAVDTEKPYSTPFGYEPKWAVAQDNMTFVVFENAYAAPLMYAQDKSLSYDTWKNLGALDKARAMLKYVITQDSANKEAVINDSFVSLGDFGTHFTYTFDEDQIEKVVTVNFPRSEEVIIQLYDNGVLVKKFYSYEPNYSSLYSEVAFDTIEVDVTNLWGVPDAEFVNTVYLQDPQADMTVWHQAITQDAFDLKLDTNAFYASGHSSKTQWIVTSIAYDANWTLEVNSKPVKLEKVNGGFIGFEIPQGDIVIEAHYFPKEILQGLTVTSLSIVYILGRYFFKKRQG